MTPGLQCCGDTCIMNISAWSPVSQCLRNVYYYSWTSGAGIQACSGAQVPHSSGHPRHQPNIWAVRLEWVQWWYLRISHHVVMLWILSCSKKRLNTRESREVNCSRTNTDKTFQLNQHRQSRERCDKPDLTCSEHSVSCTQLRAAQVMTKFSKVL